MKYTALFLLLMLVCCNSYTPKPRAMLRLEYPNPVYVKNDTEKAYSFLRSTLTRVKKLNDNNINVDYPRLKASIHITYKNINKNLDLLLKDAQKLTYGHVIKADEIIEQPYVDHVNRVYGMYYSVTGNAASQTQMYLTDSIRHFVTATIYFYAKPNYDSLYPAASYLRTDVKKIMETLKWKK